MLFGSKEKRHSRFTQGLARTFLFATLFLSASSVVQGQNLITGTVKAADTGEPLLNVTVSVKGNPQLGTVTDFDGNFTLSTPTENPILVFSYVGYLSKEVSIANESSITVSLDPSTESLDEIVIIGYGSVKKSDLTGSVVSVGGEALTKQPISNVAEALTGRLAGVQISSSEGSPDAEINIRVRGAGSLTQDSSPLVIVDGFPINSLNDISPTDIDTISVLKDASATAIYGSRGANGVVLVTTKKGKAGKISVNANAYFGYSKIANTIDVLQPDDFVLWQREYALLRDLPESYERFFGEWQDYDQYIGLKGNDWQKQVYGEQGTLNSRDFAIRGGSDAINFNFNYAHFDQKAIQIGSDFKRDNLSLALRSEASEKIDLSFTIRYSDTEINGGGANEQNEFSSADARLRNSVGYSPIPLPGITTTNTDEALAGYLVNPLVSVADNQRQQLRRNYNLLGGLGWEIIDNLKLQSDFGIDFRNDQDFRFYGRSTYYSNNVPSVENLGLPSLIFSDRKRESFRNANTLNYDFEKFLNNDHRLQLLVGEEIIINKDTRTTTEINGYPADFDFNNAVSLTTQGSPNLVDNFISADDKLLSFFGRANYSFLNRYLLTATFRADGSSKFAKGNRWGYFPSAAVAWKLDQENFLNEVDWVDNLKLRVSYGAVGNNNIPPNQAVQTFESNDTNYLNNITDYWSTSRTLFNPDLKWETTVTQNAGLDFTLFNGRFSGTAEVYKNLTKDLLVNFPIPGTGYISQFRNLGEVQNSGIELTLNYTLFNEQDYGADLSFNIGFNNNRINSLGGDLINFGANTNWASSQIGNDYLVQVGQPIGIMYGYQSDGRYEIDDFTYDPTAAEPYTLIDGVPSNEGIVGTPRPGNMKLKDINGDGVVDVDDRTIIGDANPDAVGGFTLNANAYGFDLTAAFNFSIGNDVYNANKIEFTTSNLNSQYRNLSTMQADGVRWTNLNPETGLLVQDPQELAALNANTTMWSPFSNNFVFSDWAVEDGSFLRLNTLSLGYTLPETIISNYGLTKVRFYATASNVFILTNYSGLDPEVSTRRRTPLTPGVDFSPYPRSRQIVFGLNLNF
ncbi:SusC/RagA family TonB-linked outer membrane protein [Nonlabens agnitus]|uniref:SusC/RagA family protein n=1 Tax=Nonlabens agnitus TaxID=870484 RepID=A0A2S9WY83_9FLAO|nr:TonB-dependent receptor [Nonlabens agnitus]PRP68423.1 SusC/RagA family protein [Nonlabens agnitus]